MAVVQRQNNRWRIVEVNTLDTLDSRLEEELRLMRNQIKPIQQIVLGLPEIPVLIKEIPLDSNLSDREIYQYLKLQTTIILGRPFDDWFLDFEPCLFSLTAQQTYFRIVAILKSPVMEYLKICEAARLKIKALDIDIFALTRLMSNFEDSQIEKPQGLLYLKENELVFLASQNHQLIYFKKISYSVHDSLSQLLSSLIQFYNSIFPKYNLYQIFFLGNEKKLLIEDIPIKTPLLNRSIWQYTCSPQINELTSLGLATYGY